MALYKRGKYWRYDFRYRGRRYQGSTEQANRNKAVTVEAKIRSDLALEAHGIPVPRNVPLVTDFLNGRFLQHVRQHSSDKPRTVKFYADKVKRLVAFPPFARMRLNELDETAVSDYCASRKIAVSTLNGELATIRKAIGLAYEWRLIARKPRVRRLPGENRRDFVITRELEALYLALAPVPLRQAAILMLDCGLRPEECVSLKKVDISQDDLGLTTHEANGPMPSESQTLRAERSSAAVWSEKRVSVTITITGGKSKNAARTLPLTQRAKEAIEFLCAVWPKSEWLFHGRKGHFHRTALDNIHAKLRREHDLPAEFVLYSCRHTFATRLAESGASPWQIQRLMGHGDITMSQRYVHVGDDDLRVAVLRLEAANRLLSGHEEAPVKERS